MSNPYSFVGFATFINPEISLELTNNLKIEKFSKYLTGYRVLDFDGEILMSKLKNK